MIILGLVYFAIAPLSCFVDCYSYHLLDEECKTSNDTEITIQARGALSGAFLQSYETEWTLQDAECRMSIVADSDSGIVLCVLLAKFDRGCKGNEYLNFSSSQRFFKFCRTFYGYNYHTTCYRFDEPNVTVTYSTANGMPPKYRLVANTFYQPPCRKNEFECREEHICIWDGYFCDGINNCIDYSDELYNDKPRDDCINRNKWMWMIFLSILPLVIICLCGAVFYVVRSTERKSISRPEFVYLSSSRPCAEVRLNSLLERRMRILAAEDKLLRNRPAQDETLDKNGHNLPKRESLK